MNKFYDFISSKRKLDVIFLLFVLVYFGLFIITLLRCEWKVVNNDGYKDLFIKFHELGYYKSVAQGTSILYNLCLNFIFAITKSVDASFFILNIFSNLFLLFFGYYFCKKVLSNNTKVSFFYIVFSIYALYTLNMKSYFSASNDTFLAVFVVVLLYFLVVKLFDTKNTTFTFFAIGFVFAICFSIRITSVLLLPLIFLSFFYWIRNVEISLWERTRLLGACFSIFFLVLFILHYPSLKDRHALSYEDKNPSKELNWIQRNYLGLKKIELGKEKIHRDAIWKNTKFEKVQEYLKIHGDNSLPRTFTQAVFKDPILVLKITFLNIITSLVRFFRFWGILFFIPFIILFKEDFFNKYKLSTLLFLSLIFILSFVCFTFIEFRWFYGYEVLIPISILCTLNKIDNALELHKIHSIVVISLLLITVFNVKSIISVL